MDPELFAIKQGQNEDVEGGPRAFAREGRADTGRRSGSHVEGEGGRGGGQTERRRGQLKRREVGKVSEAVHLA